MSPVRQPEFGRRLRRLREEMRLGVGEFAKSLRCHRSYVYRLESGEAENPTQEFVARIVAATLVSPAWFHRNHALAKPTFLQPGVAQTTVAEESLRAVLSTLSLDDLRKCAGHFFLEGEKPGAVGLMNGEIASLVLGELRLRLHGKKNK